MDLSISPALLFTPGNKPERFSKALVSEANGLILELEDAVPLEDKNRLGTTSCSFYCITSMLIYLLLYE